VARFAALLEKGIEAGSCGAILVARAIGDEPAALKHLVDQVSPSSQAEQR
jgi:hypothetical protein